MNWACICGSDRHLHHGLVPDTRVGTTFGHEFAGVVEEAGEAVQNLKVSGQVLVPFHGFCGSCYFCRRELYSSCRNVSPEASAIGANLRVFPQNFSQSLTGTKPKLQGGAATVLHRCINSVRKGGKVSTVDVYGPTFNAIPVGNAVNKGLTLRINQAKGKRHFPRLIEHVQAGRIKPGEVITHRMPLEEVADAHRMRSSKLGNCIKTVLVPPRSTASTKEGLAMDTRHGTIDNPLKTPSRFAHTKGWGADLMRGHVPNVFAEMGAKAQFKYNREAAVQKTVVLFTIALLGLLL